jgi:O-methyltransferase
MDLSRTTDQPGLAEEIPRAYAKIAEQRPWRDERSHLIHHRVLPNATRAPWLNDKRFMALYKAIQPHTLVDLYRCFELWSLAAQCARMDGDILEVGVWRGGTGAVLAEAVRDVPGMRVYLADTFEGVVKAGAHDTRYEGGEHADTSLALVHKLMASRGLDNVTLLQGIFPEATGSQGPARIALLHCDVDVYESTRDIVAWALPRMAAGAVIVFDDYGFFGCEGVTTYCEEFAQRPEFRFIHNLNGHAVFVKVA